MTLHVFQKNGADCMLACIAMAAGKTYNELWTAEDSAEVVELGGSQPEHTKKLLERAGFHSDVNGDQGAIVWKCHVWDNQSRDQLVRGLLRGRRAIISVPSLNNRAGWHVVFWDGQDLYDPNNPSAGKQIYRWIDQLAINTIWIFDERGEIC